MGCSLESLLDPFAKLIFFKGTAEAGFSPSVHEPSLTQGSSHLSSCLLVCLTEKGSPSLFIVFPMLQEACHRYFSHGQI